LNLQVEQISQVKLRLHGEKTWHHKLKLKQVLDLRPE
jgi:hypothetical protein